MASGRASPPPDTNHPKTCLTPQGPCEPCDALADLWHSEGGLSIWSPDGWLERAYVLNIGGSPCSSDSLLNDICLSPDERRVVTVGGMGNGSGSGELWDVRSGERIAEVDQSTGAFFCVISPDSKRFLTAGGWETVL